MYFIGTYCLLFLFVVLKYLHFNTNSAVNVSSPDTVANHFDLSKSFCATESTVYGLSFIEKYIFVTSIISSCVGPMYLIRVLQSEPFLLCLKPECTYSDEDSFGHEEPLFLGNCYIIVFLMLTNVSGQIIAHLK